MSSIGRLVSMCADLAEAEGRLLRMHAIRFAAALAMLIVSAAFAVAGLALLLIGLYLWLEPEVGEALAAAICGAICILIVGGLAWQVRRLQSE